MSRRPIADPDRSSRNRAENTRLAARRTHGTSAASGLARMLVRSTLALASGTLLPACLTQNVQYDAPRNYPPSIESRETARHPLNSVIQVPIRVAGDGGTATSNVIELHLAVRDPNIDQTLEYRVFVDFNPERPQIDLLQRIQPDRAVEDGLTRRVDIDIPVTQLGVGMVRCHRIEVLVSSAFRDDGLRTPVEPGDLATATWWVARQDDDMPVVDMTECL